MFIKPVSKSLFLFLLLVATACGAQKSSAVADLRKTVQVVNKGMEALGSAAPWVSVRTLSIDYIGCKDLDGQCHAFGVVPVSLPFQNVLYADFRNDRLINETQDRYLGGCLLHFRAVYSNSAAFSYEVPRMRFSGVTDLPLTTRGSTRQTLLHHIPAYVVKAALEKKLSLRFAGRVQEREKVIEVVSFPYTPTLTLDLYFDTATHLLEKYRFFTDQLIHGDQEVEYRYPAYDRVHGLLFLSQKKIFINGSPSPAEALKSIEVNEGKADSLFRAPLHLAAPVVLPTRVVATGNHLFMIEGLRGYCPLNFKEHIVLIEAVNGTEEALKLIARQFPGKPVAKVILSLHHEGHTIGLPGLIQKRILILTMPSNRVYVHHFINAQHSVRTPGTEAGSAVVETLSDRKTLSDENLTLEIIPVGRKSHAQELRAFYFPRERILYLADRGALVQPLILGNRELYDIIKREKLVVDTIYGVHWKGVPFKQLEKALQNEKKINQ